MSELTKNEAKVLAELKIALSDKEMLNKVITANYLVSEIAYQFGVDVAEFVIGHQSGVLQDNAGLTSGEIPILSRAGNLASYGYGKFASEVNDIMCNIDNKSQVYVHSEEAKELSAAVNKLSDCEKTPWKDNYDKARADGIIK